MAIDPEAQFRQPKERCRLHGVAMMVDGYCLECGQEPPGWGETNTPLNVGVLRRLSRHAALGALAFGFAYGTRPGIFRAFWLLGASACWLYAVDTARRQGWTRLGRRHWQAAEIALSAVMLLLILFNRLIG